jgi:transposase-like protein
MFFQSAQRPVSAGVDETYLKVRGRWVYLYRAVDKEGNTVDFRLSPKRDVAAAKAFFRKALRTQGRAPLRITLDGYAASHCAVREMPSENEVWKHTKLRSSKYLNNLIEQDHRGIKSRTGPMLGFKRFDYAAITIAGIELLRRIHKGQFALGSLRLKDQVPPLSGTLSSLHRSIPLQNSFCPTEIICTRAPPQTNQDDLNRKTTALENGHRYISSTRLSLYSTRLMQQSP